MADEPAVTVNAGEVFLIPARSDHRVRNVGRGPEAELATRVVERGKPIVVVDRS